MKKIVFITMLWLLQASLASAAVPKAELALTALNSAQWPAEYRLTLTVPEHHHAYLDAGEENAYLPVVVDPDAKLAALHLAIMHMQPPGGVYDPAVKATVLRNQGDFVLTLERLNGEPTAAPVALDVRYQLCNDDTHVCYRPQTAQVNLALPAAASAATETAVESASINDRLMALFKANQNNTFLLLGLMFLAGILSVATPCVYPMLPITSIFIVNRANGIADKEKLHALAYVVGMIGTYAALGLMAGMTGGAFNTFMQSGWVNIGFALFFGFFAISLLGYYELSFLQNEVYSLDQHSAQVKGLTGTWLMGSVAGLVISPCVGPIVFALLLQVADQIAEKANALTAMGQQLTFWDKLGVAAQGSVLMGGFGLGVGLPFFIVSIVKFKKLPKAGYWMNKIKYAFGLMILYFAYLYFAKGLGVFGVDAAVTLSLALGLLAVWVAVVHCSVLSLLPHDTAPNQKMHRYCGVLALVGGVWLLVSGLGRTPIIPTVQANAQLADCAVNNTPAIEQEAGISWHRNFAAAQKVALQTGKPIFIDFYASWCANCKAFKEEAANDAHLNQALREQAVAVKLVDKEPEFEKFREHPEHRLLKIGLPYFAILSPDGKLLWSGTDYKATDKMISVLAGSEQRQS